MSRSIRKDTSSLAFGIVGRFGGSSAGFVVAALNAASAASREVVVLRVLSAGIFVLALGLYFLNRKLGMVTMGWITLGEPSGPGASCGLSRGKARWRHATCHFRRSRTRKPEANPCEVSLPSNIIQLPVRQL